MIGGHLELTWHSMEERSLPEKGRKHGDLGHFMGIKSLGMGCDEGTTYLARRLAFRRLFFLIGEHIS